MIAGHAGGLLAPLDRRRARGFESDRPITTTA